MSDLRHERLVEGSDLEGRVANVLLGYEHDHGPEADTIRWLAANVLHPRRAIVEAAKLTADPDVLHVLREGLEVQGDE